MFNHIIHLLLCWGRFPSTSNPINMSLVLKLELHLMLPAACYPLLAVAWFGLQLYFTCNVYTYLTICCFFLLTNSYYYFRIFLIILVGSVWVMVRIIYKYKRTNLCFRSNLWPGLYIHLCSVYPVSIKAECHLSSSHSLSSLTSIRACHKN
jgi:hypothetical protein